MSFGSILLMCFLSFAISGEQRLPWAPPPSEAEGAPAATFVSAPAEPAADSDDGGREGTKLRRATVVIAEAAPRNGSSDVPPAAFGDAPPAALGDFPDTGDDAPSQGDDVELLYHMANGMAYDMANGMAYDMAYRSPYDNGYGTESPRPRGFRGLYGRDHELCRAAAPRHPHEAAHRPSGPTHAPAARPLGLPPSSADTSKNPTGAVAFAHC